MSSVIGLGVQAYVTETPPLPVNGFIDGTLARGIEKRMVRENNDHSSEVLARLKRGKGPPKNRAKWMQHAVDSGLEMSGELVVGVIEAPPHTRIVLRMDRGKVEGAYHLVGMDINGKKRRVRSVEFAIALSSHAVQRYFERVRVPFSFNAFGEVLAESLGHEPGVAYMLAVEAGLFIFEPVEIEGRMINMAKTFLGHKEMNVDQQITWNMQME